MTIIIIIAIVVFVVCLEVAEGKEMYKNKSRFETAAKGQVYCPKCGCTQLSANKKGATITLGLLGSQNVTITCLKCGFQWKAGTFK